MDGNGAVTIINTKQWVVSTSFAAICLVWYIAIILFSLLGYVQLYVVVRLEDKVSI